MQYLVRLGVISSFVVLTCPSAYACSIPETIPIPDGKTASEKEMLSADAAIKDYISRLLDYTDCIEQETHVLRSNAVRGDMASTKSREESAAKLQNEAAAAIEKVAEQFNRSIANYKERGL